MKSSKIILIKRKLPLADEPTVGIEKLDPKGDLVLVVGESKIVPGSLALALSELHCASSTPCFGVSARGTE